MNANQIAFKPFVTRLAQREGMSYDQMIQSQGSQLASVPVEEFVGSKDVQGSNDFARVVRAQSSDIQQMQAELTQIGVNPKVAEGYANMMLVTALALDPCTATGLDSAMRMLLLDEKPLETSAVQSGQLNLQPALDKLTQEMGTDLPTLLSQAAQEYKEATPEQLGSPKLADQTRLASIFQVNPGDICQLQDSLSKEGLTEQQSDGIISGLVLSAVAFEPSLRPGLHQIASLIMRDEKPMAESAIVSA